MNWTNDWEYRPYEDNGKKTFYHFYEGDWLWVYVGKLVSSRSYQDYISFSLPADWQERLFDIAKGGDWLARLKAFSAIENLGERDEIKKILGVWAAAECPEDTLDASTALITNPNEFRILSVYSKHAFYRLSASPKEIEENLRKIEDIINVRKGKSTEIIPIAETPRRLEIEGWPEAKPPKKRVVIEIKAPKRH